MIVATICSLDAPAAVDQMERNLLPELAASTPPAVATVVEESSANTFPALPVRTGEHVVVWIQRTDPTAVDATIKASAELARASIPRLVGEPAHLLLEPTPRSRLR
jgi:hypothetical protein